MKNNKEIKFRAWDEISGKWLIWDYYDNTKSGSCFWDIAYGMPINQFTGLKDKNGKEIYEGDIVKVGDYVDNQIIKYGDWINNGEYMESGYGYNFFGYSNEECEVIGNIYENPNLLTK